MGRRGGAASSVIDPDRNRLRSVRADEGPARRVDQDPALHGALDIHSECRDILGLRLSCPASAGRCGLPSNWRSRCVRAWASASRWLSSGCVIGAGNPGALTPR
jgi:hypothetical protein